MKTDTTLNDFFVYNVDYFIRPSNEPLEDRFLGPQLKWEKFDDRFFREDLFIYTLVKYDFDEAWIHEGFRAHGALGYYITTREIEIPDEGIRYW